MITVALAALLTTQTAATEGPGRIVPAPLRAVSIGGSFWGPRLAVLRDATLAANRHQCSITGRLSNFDKAAAKIGGDPNSGAYEGLLFNDSDVYKMIEGWACIVATETDAARRESLDKELDALIARIAAAQHPDGYINTYYTLKAGIEKRFTREEHDHETYCMGHLIEAGAMHFQVTGQRNLLDVAVKAADFLRNLYGPGKFTVPPGHQELELALIKLAEATGERKYIDFAHELIELRGRPHRSLDGTLHRSFGEDLQDVKPATELREVSGHAVRAGYYYSAMADLARLGHAEYTPALHSLWEDITQRRIFVTGGIGPSGRNEGFTVPFDIPTTSAYQETCASIALCLWAHRMFMLEGDGRYMAQFEHTLYNAVLAGVSLNGSEFFYVNPLASRGGHPRQAWFSCACCPPNILRFFAELGPYVYAVKGDTVYVNLFMDSKATLTLGADTVVIEQKTDYPFGGRIRISAASQSGRQVTIAIRDAQGLSTLEMSPDGYRRTTIAAHSSGTVEWEVPMSPTRIYSDPRVKASLGRVAIMRGPLVYAVESIDNGAVGADLATFVLPPTAAVIDGGGTGGAPTLVAIGFSASSPPIDEGSPSGNDLYRRSDHLTPVKFSLRPYFMWANRGDSSMRVWLAESSQFLDPQPPNGAKLSASHVYSGDTLEAIADGISPDPSKGSSDESIPRMTFWPRRGTTEWVRYDFGRPRLLRTSTVYWFDDTGKGRCRVPREAVVEYLDGEEWKTVSAGTDGRLGVARDAINTISFAEVTTTAIRLRVMLQDGMSAGVFEWTVGR